jgi:hypothetical protein
MLIQRILVANPRNQKQLRGLKSTSQENDFLLRGECIIESLSVDLDTRSGLIVIKQDSCR